MVIYVSLLGFEVFIYDPEKEEEMVVRYFVGQLEFWRELVLLQSHLVMEVLLYQILLLGSPWCLWLLITSGLRLWMRTSLLPTASFLRCHHYLRQGAFYLSLSVGF